jgi:hypothetical protein
VILRRSRPINNEIAAYRRREQQAPGVHRTHFEETQVLPGPPPTKAPSVSVSAFAQVRGKAPDPEPATQTILVTDQIDEKQRAASEAEEDLYIEAMAGHLKQVHEALRPQQLADLDDLIKLGDDTGTEQMEISDVASEEIEFQDLDSRRAVK